MPLTAVISTSSGPEPWSACSSTERTWSSRNGISPDDERRRARRRATSASAEQDRRHDRAARPGRVPRSGPGAAGRRRRRRPSTRPRGRTSRGRTRRCRARGAARSRAPARRATTKATVTTWRRRRARCGDSPVVARDDVPQRSFQPGAHPAHPLRGDSTGAPKRPRRAGRSATSGAERRPGCARRPAAGAGAAARARALAAAAAAPAPPAGAWRRRSTAPPRAPTGRAGATGAALAAAGAAASDAGRRRTAADRRRSRRSRRWPPTGDVEDEAAGHGDPLARRELREHRVGRAVDLRGGRLDAGRPGEVADVAHLVVGHQRDHGAGGAGARRTARAVQVGLVLDRAGRRARRARRRRRGCRARRCRSRPGCWPCRSGTPPCCGCGRSGSGCRAARPWGRRSC